MSKLLEAVEAIERWAEEFGTAGYIRQHLDTIRTEDERMELLRRECKNQAWRGLSQVDMGRDLRREALEKIAEACK